MSKQSAHDDEQPGKAEKPFAVKASGRLLLLQAAGLLALGWWLIPLEAAPDLIEEWQISIWFVLGLLCAWVALRFMREREGARYQAILMQGFTLGFGLINYALQHPFYIYPVLFFSILIVLYLQHWDVRRHFARPLKTEKGH